MNPQPLITVVMPAYKVAPYIGQALQSVLAQSFTDYEVIVVNDGSPDSQELESVLEPYAIRVLYIKQENRGVSAARNRALRAARGKVVAFLDADDLWLPNYLAEQVKFMLENNADLVCADAVYFGDSRLAGYAYMEACTGKGPSEGEVTFLGLVSGAQCLITSGILARRKPILEVGLFDEALRDSEDFDLWLRLARHGARMLYHRRLLLRYRCHRDSLSGDEFNVLTRGLRAYDRIEQSYNLTLAERAEVLSAIGNRRALLEFELGKLHLARGEFAHARECFAKANRSWRSWKTQAALGLSRLAPRLMQFLYQRRVGDA